MALTGWGGAAGGDVQISCLSNPPGLSLYCVPLLSVTLIISYSALLKCCVVMVASLLFTFCFIVPFFLLRNNIEYLLFLFFFLSFLFY